MVDPVPHPLVAGLVQQLVLKRGWRDYDDETKQRIAVNIGVQDSALSGALKADPATLRDERTATLDDALETGLKPLLEKDASKLTADDKRKLASLAAYVDIPDVVPLAGYLGGTVEAPLADGTPGRWRILYMDTQLQNWRLIPESAILLQSTVTDQKAPFNVRDIIWVLPDAFTAKGGAPPGPQVQAQYLQGPFTRAAELTAAVGGGEVSAATGEFCEVISFTCCTRPVRP